MLKRTPILAIVIGLIIAFIVKYFVESPARPFSAGQLVLLYVLSYIVAVGIALLFDPKSAETKRNYLKINFYKEK